MEILLFIEYSLVFMSLSNIEVIYKVMIKRLVFTLGFPVNYLLGAYFWYSGEGTWSLFLLNMMISNILVLWVVCSFGDYL